ncbi:hypothetical protein CSAL01_13153 [Colletotrichum salicis]|uniref:Uncharacterized protein n=1 Tax=Colletotrichum salicis TaxID=1209931 RepID=A0A135UVX0_9PEZI|nr:hypothetical protein CSAL01_13153 [Colletotrichum salicis]
MADAIETAASVVGLVGALLKTVQEIRKGRANQVREEPRLQVPAVVDQLEILRAIVEELYQLFKKLQEKSRRRTFPRFTKALVTQDADETEVAYISNRLANATAELDTGINVIQADLTGKAVKLLEGIDSKAHQDTNLSEFTDPEFLSNLSSVHPSKDVAHFRHFYQTSASPFDCGQLARNLKDRKGMPFMFFDDETGLGHSMFTFAIVNDLRIYYGYYTTAYFLCKDTGSDPRPLITTSTILGGLTRILLRLLYHSDSSLLTQQNRTFGHELKTYSDEIDRAGSFHRILDEIF